MTALLITVPYYPLWMSAGGALFVAALPILFGARLSLPVLVALGAFFGNHPGGRGLEFYDLALIFSLLHRIPDLITRLRSEERTEQSYLLLLLGLSTAISYCGAFYLLEAFEGYKLSPFHFLSAREWLPHYSLKVAAANLVCAALCMDWLQSIKSRAFSDTNAAVLLLIALLVPTTVGILEILSPQITLYLDNYHVWLDGYVDRTPPHQVFANSIPFPNEYAPNSLFWNRSWFALYLISCLPIAGIAIQCCGSRFPKSRRALGSLGLLLLTTLAFQFFCIGARAGFLAYSVFLVLLFLLLAKRKPGRFLPWTVVCLTAAFLLLLPFLSYTTIGDSLLGERAELYQSGIALFLQFPIAGSGVESFGFWNDLLLRGMSYQRTFASTHNFLIQVGAGMGILGIALVSYFLYRTFRFSIDRMAGSAATGKIAPALFIAGAIAFLIYGGFQEIWYLRGVQLNWWLMITAPGIIWKESRSPEIIQSIAKSMLRRRIAGVSLVFVMLFLASVSMYRGFTLGHRYDLFENTGHLQLLPGSTDIGYALLEGDGSFLRMNAGTIEITRFNCSEADPSLTGQSDPRKICRYEKLAPSEVAQESPPDIHLEMER